MAGTALPSQINCRRQQHSTTPRGLLFTLALGYTWLIGGCASQHYPDGLHWFRDSAEQKAIYIEAYRAAAESAKRLSTNLPPQTWAVILDIDETILDNSDYQKRLALSGKSYDAKSWDAWVHEAAATALPGAKAFVDAVLDDMRGQVILITNRTQAQCAITENNLRVAEIRYSRILCDTVGDNDKNERFRSVMAGEPGVAAPLRVLVWIGDNIQDFPNLSQANPGDPEVYGSRYFVLPNPMYGSWISVAPH
jgi:5'-nucleotidase (lipoprotein e(P4) family)